ncbi:MAG: ABC transporter permease subunit [Anaerolineae bacterium]|nr:ABC transporter permease subunit [Anaerolineae bacterium]
MATHEQSVEGTSTGAIVSLEQPMRKSEGLWMDALRRLLRNRAAVAGLVTICLLILGAIFADVVTPTISLSVKGQSVDGSWFLVDVGEVTGAWVETKQLPEEALPAPLTPAPVKRLLMPFAARVTEPTTMYAEPDPDAGVVLADFAGEVTAGEPDASGAWLQVSTTTELEAWVRASVVEIPAEETESAKITELTELYDQPSQDGKLVLEDFASEVVVLDQDESGEWLLVEAPAEIEGWVDIDLVVLQFKRTWAAEAPTAASLYEQPRPDAAVRAADFTGALEVTSKDPTNQWFYVRTAGGTEGWIDADATLFDFEPPAPAQTVEPASLYAQPDPASPLVLADFAGAVTVIGQDRAGKWLYVSTEDGAEGWIDAEPVAFVLAEPRAGQLTEPGVLYGAPGPGAAQLSELAAGAKVSVLGQDASGDWVQVRARDDIEGWISIDPLLLPLESPYSLAIHKVVELRDGPARGAETVKLLAPRDYYTQVREYNNAAPEWITVVFPTMKPQGVEGGYVLVNNDYPLGADYLGRDLLTRILYGARISLMVAAVGPAVSLLIGLVWGVTSGYFGGRVDNIMMRIVDIMYAFPTLLLIILMMAFFRSSFVESEPGTLAYVLNELDTALGGMLFIFIGIGMTSWMGMARLSRGQVLSVREKEFVEAARAIGQGTRGIMFGHIMPNILGPLIVAETLAIPGYISTEAFLSFIGLGVNRPTPSWGSMISDGSQALRSYPNQAIFPALALGVTMFAFNFLGDGLRDALDPRMRGVD